MSLFSMKQFGAAVARWLCAVSLSASTMAFIGQAHGGVKRKPSVLILHTSTAATDTQAKLAATGLFGAVDLFNAAASELGTPTLAQMLPYDAVLVSPDYAEPFADNVALGNNLADYVDAGGGVVCNALATCTFAQLAGRWAPNYQVITPGAAPIYFSPQSIDFASVTDPNNQLLIGVGSFSCGAAPRAAQTAVSAGSTVIARWTNGGHVLAAMSNSLARVDLNIYAPSADAGLGFWNPSTDGTKLIANSLLAVIRPRVALVASTLSTTVFATVRNSLRIYAPLGIVDSFNTRDLTPTLDQLSRYDSLLLWSDVWPLDYIALGNVLADYVDRGGGVVMDSGMLGSFTSLGGRWQSGNYGLATSAPGAIGQCAAVYPGHPITQNLIFSAPNTDLLTPAPGAYSVATHVVSGQTRPTVLASSRFPNQVVLGYDVTSAIEPTLRMTGNALIYAAKPYITCVTTSLGFGEAADVRAKLLATKRFSGVGLVLADSSITVSSEVLKPFSGVLFWGMTAVGEAKETEIGNQLADFVDAGGGAVVAGDSILAGGPRPRGRWISQGYDITPDASLPLRISTPATLGAALEANHPVNGFVRKFEGNSTGRQATTPLLRGRTLLQWSDGTALASEHNFRRRIDVNVYPPSDSAIGGLWNHRTDGTWLMANALEYAVRHAPCPGDFNSDAVVDDTDFTLFIAAYTELVDPRGDLTGDGNTDDSDFTHFVNNYNRLLCP